MSNLDLFKHEWVPISKLVPAKDTEVMAFYPTGDAAGAGFCIVAYYDGKDLWDANRSVGKERLTDLVTHWRPLPPPPAAKVGAEPAPEPRARVMNGEHIQKGVAEAFDFWLSQHDVSTPAIIKEAISESFTKWLDANTDEIIERMAVKALITQL